MGNYTRPRYPAKNLGVLRLTNTNEYHAHPQLLPTPPRRGAGMNIPALFEALKLPDLPALALVGIGIGMFLTSTALAVFIVVRLPRDYFANPRQQMLPPESKPLLRLVLRIVKNIAGWLLIMVGIALSLPAMPGEGILTALIGLVLIDFPGKSRLEQKIIRIGWIRKTLNHVRARFNRAPLSKSRR